jgi:hypothetical protein
MAACGGGPRRGRPLRGRPRFARKGRFRRPLGCSTNRSRTIRHVVAVTARPPFLARVPRHSRHFLRACEDWSHETGIVPQTQGQSPAPAPPRQDTVPSVKFPSARSAALRRSRPSGKAGLPAKPALRQSRPSGEAGPPAKPAIRAKRGPRAKPAFGAYRLHRSHTRRSTCARNGGKEEFARVTRFSDSTKR